jgi:hypothetical protein
MSAYRDSKVLNVFLASPGDLIDERRIAHEVADELNLSMGRQLNWRIELLGWEDTLPGFFRPQEKINEDVDRCELFAGMLWKRWGQPTGAGRYQSGFEEEFERAVQRRERENFPEIWLFFKTIDEDARRDPGEQLKRVIDFREKIVERKIIKFSEFTSPADWEKLFRKSLTSYLLELSRKEGSLALRELPTAAPGAPAMDSIAQPDETERTSSEDKNAKKAIHSLNAVTKALEAGALAFNSTSELNESDLARITALASAFLSVRFPTELLGVHQVNLLYKFHGEITLTAKEWSVAVRSSFGSNSKLVPVWFWIRPTAKVSKYLLDLVISDASHAVRVGATRTIRELGLRYSARDKRALFQGITTYYDEDVAKQILIWLGQHGAASDQWFLEQIRNNQPSLKNEIERTRAQILARDNPSHVITCITANDVDAPDSLVRELTAGIDLAPLKSLIAHKSANVRKFAARALAQHELLSKEDALQLFDDSNQDVRIVGISSAIAQRIPVKPKTIRDKVQSLGLLSLGDSSAEALVRQSFENFEYSELTSYLSWNGMDAPLAYEVLATNHFQTFEITLRQDLHENFERYHRKWRDDLTNLGETGKSIIADYQREGLNDFIRKKFLIAALRGLAANGSKSDTDLVKAHLGSSDSSVLAAIAQFLGRTGDRNDINTLLEMASKTWTHTDEFLSYVYKLSDDPIVLVVNDATHIRLRAKFLSLLSDDEFRKLRGKWIALLLSDDPEFRKQTVRRIATLTTRAMRRRILDEYLSREIYYYDVVFWMDRLSYAPRAWTLAFLTSLERDIKNPFAE